MSREIFTPQHQLHLYLARVNAKRIIESNEENISIASDLFILTSNEECIEDYIANTKHNLYLLYVKPIELTSNVEEND